MALQTAQAQSVSDRYNRLVRDSSEVAALDFGLFGDQVNPHDGSTSFRVTDVAVPTNGALPLSVGRRLDISAQYADEQGRSSASVDILFGKYWLLDIPYMRGTFDAIRGWVGRDTRNPAYLQSATQNRCSMMDHGPPPTLGTGHFLSVEYHSEQFFSGIQINLPGKGNEQLVAHHPITVAGKSYPARTRSEWLVGCVSSVKNGPGEGFEVLTPDGTRYIFDWMYSRLAPSVIDTNCAHGNGKVVMPSEQLLASPWQSELQENRPCNESEAIPRKEIFLYATRVTDRFGNTISYDYERVLDQYGSYQDNYRHPGLFRLNRIHASDGASIELTYDASNRIQSIVSSGRRWTYQYENGELRHVVLPDGSQWSFDYGANIVEVNRFLPLTVWRGCQVNVDTKTTATAAPADESNRVSMTHPSGAQGVFEFRKIMHGTRQSEAGCWLVGGNWILGGHRTPVMQNPSAWQATSLVRKSITGAGLSPQQWTYFYQAGWTAPFESTTTVTDIAGTREDYVFGNDCYFSNKCLNFGLLLRKSVGNSSTTLRTEAYDYLTSAVGQAYPAEIGTLLWFGGKNGNGRAFNYNRPLIRTRITQDGRQHVREIATGCGSPSMYCLDTRLRPLREVRSSSP